MALASLVVAELDERRLNYDRLPNQPPEVTKYRFVMSSRDGTNMHYIVDVKDRGANSIVLVYAYLDGKVAGSARDMTAEFITRVNYSLKIGTFEMDLSDGEVRYRVSTPLGNARHVKPIIHNMLEYSLSTPLKYFKALRYGIEKNMSARAALDLATSDSGSGGSSGSSRDGNAELLALLLALAAQPR